jgi:microcystin-dependent protein
MSDPFLGEIRLFPWNFAPVGWALCDGAILGIAQNTALFSLLGTMYGGNGTTNFQLPDLRGRAATHVGNNFSQGEQDGQEQVTLTIATMPSHQHTFFGTSAAANSKTPGGNTLTTDSVAGDNFYGPDTKPFAINPQSISQMGGNQPHNNLQPFLVLNYCIALQGIFPSRN